MARPTEVKTNNKLSTKISGSGTFFPGFGPKLLGSGVPKTFEN